MELVRLAGASQGTLPFLQPPRTVIRGMHPHAWLLHRGVSGMQTQGPIPAQQALSRSAACTRWRWQFFLIIRLPRDILLELTKEVLPFFKRLFMVGEGWVDEVSVDGGWKTIDRIPVLSYHMGWETELGWSGLTPREIWKGPHFLAPFIALTSSSAPPLAHHRPSVCQPFGASLDMAAVFLPQHLACISHPTWDTSSMVLGGSFVDFPQLFQKVLRVKAYSTIRF